MAESVPCPWCRQPKKPVVKVQFVYLPQHSLTIGGKPCPGSGLPLRAAEPGEEPTDHFQ